MNGGGNSKKRALLCTQEASKLGQFYDKKGHYPDKTGALSRQNRNFQDQMKRDPNWGTFTIKRDIIPIKLGHIQAKIGTFKIK